MERTVNLRLSEKIEDIAYLKADALLAPSYLNARAVENAIGRPVTVIETPFIMETVELDDSVYRLYLQHKKYLLFFGTIGLMKGCGLIAEIIYELLDQELDLYFAFVGKDTGYLGYKGESIMDRIRKNAKQHVERIIHIDRLPHKYLYPIISHSYAVVLPSRVDNMPNACLEAMGHRKIVIGTDGASFEQLIVDGVSGFLCKIDDKRSLLEKIQKVLSLTPEEKNIIQENAWKRIQELHPDKVVNQLVEFYRQVINDFHHKNLNQ
jgi:glycosyltransferase involved in cell wall biosynthesis